MGTKVVIWEVVGGGEQGGIIVRTGKQVTSPKEKDRIATGALIEELEVEGERMHYQVISGNGPASGWVAMKVGDKDLLAKTDKSKTAQRKVQQDREQKLNATAASTHPPDQPYLKDIGEWIYARHMENNAEITEEPQQEASTEGSSPSPDHAPWRSLFHMERVANFRDAAGPDPKNSWRCRGGKIKRGLLFRTGNWNAATPSDLKRIRDEFGIKTYIDLRTGTTYEGGRAPCFDEEWYPPCPSGRHKDLPERAPGQCRRVSIPFTKNFTMRPWRAEEKALTVKDRTGLCSWWYQQMIRDEHFSQGDLRVQLAITMRCILFINYDEVLKGMQIMTNRANYPVAYGCMAGKDRTGIFGQLVLFALGVSKEDILADYIATNQSAAHISACNQICVHMWHEEMKEKKPAQYEAMVKHGQIPAEDPYANVAGNKEQSLTDSAIVNVASSPENLYGARVYKEIMQYTFNVLENECGGVIAYLDSIGFGKAEIEKMRQILVEEDS